MLRIIFCLLILLPASAQAQISPQQLDNLASAAQPQVVQWRRWFHENPELSNREFNTAVRVAEILTEMGLEPQTGIAHTGVVAIIEGGKPGSMIAIRAASATYSGVNRGAIVESAPNVIRAVISTPPSSWYL